MSDALADALRNAQLLLVVDNCEHLLNACAMLVDLLLRECLQLHVLATSREPLGILGEVNWGLPPLPAPDSDFPESVEEVMRSPAVRLFVDRASVVHPDFTLSSRNAGAIAQICRRLDGIPLALELAAATLDALTPLQLATRLDQRFRLLTVGNRAAPLRQQTLSATIDWSYLLLDETEQRVFERVSVFANSWTIEAAEVVCIGDGVATEQVFSALLQLVRKSLVVRIEVPDGGTRYGLLETLREYALDKLHDRGAELAATKERHASYYSALVQRLDPAAPTTLLPFSGEALTMPVFDTLADVQDNVRVALSWYLETGRATEGLTLVRALGPLWIRQGIPVDGRRWLEAVLHLAGATATGQHSGVPGASSAESVAPALRAQALLFGGSIARMKGDFITARAFHADSIALWRSLGDRVGLAQALANLGQTFLEAGELTQAEVTLSESLALARATGDPFALRLALSWCGDLARLQGQYEHAAELCRESLMMARAVERESDRAYSIVQALVHLGRILTDQGDIAHAVLLFKEGLETMRKAGFAGGTLSSYLECTAIALRRLEDPLRAARLFGAAESQWRASGMMRGPVDNLTHERELRAVRAQLDEDAFEGAWHEGLAMSSSRAVAVALDEAN
jgi:predicted ATPase